MAELELRDLRVRFGLPGGGSFLAVRGVSLVVERGETVSLVGESGSGKTTTARAALRLSDGEVSGTVLLRGENLYALSSRELRRARGRVQIVFQDPFASLNPWMTVGAAVAEPLRIHGLARGAEAVRRAGEILERVGLDPGRHPGLYPREFSGGQRQRIAIARALAVEPDLLVLDEPVSALDVSEQARVLNLLSDLKEERGLAYLLIAHDLSVVEHVSDRIAVMYLGEIVEEGVAREVLRDAAHPYTRALIAAAPVPDPAHERESRTRPGEPASPLHPPSGCAFHPRCLLAEPACRAKGAEIPVVTVSPGHRARCRLAAG